MGLFPLSVRGAITDNKHCDSTAQGEEIPLEG